MGKYDGYAIFSDVDGTLYEYPGEFPKANLDAIEYFVNNGGKFTVATGRGLHAVVDLPVAKYINMPCILANGAVVYDINTKEELSVIVMSPATRALVKQVVEARPDLRVMLWDNEKRFEVGANVKVPEGSTFIAVDDFTDEWTKCVLDVDPADRIDIIKWIKSIGNEETQVSSSAARFVEILPANASKGNGVNKIISMYELDRAKVFTIGDYHNDFSMISLDGINGYCPEAAVDEVKAVAKAILCDVEKGAVAQLVALI